MNFCQLVHYWVNTELYGHGFTAHLQEWIMAPTKRDICYIYHNDYTGAVGYAAEEAAGPIARIFGYDESMIPSDPLFFQKLQETLETRVQR